MKCFLCKGKMEKGYTTHTVDVGDKGIIIIKYVPAMICEQCGEVWFEGNVAREIERIVGTIENTIATEVAIVKYADLAA
jgi:YgiT-type zinc finger domain-containing protein